METPRLSTGYAYGQVVSLEVSTSSLSRLRLALVAIPMLATTTVLATTLAASTVFT